MHILNSWVRGIISKIKFQSIYLFCVNNTHFYAIVNWQFIFLSILIILEEIKLQKNTNNIIFTINSLLLTLFSFWLKYIKNIP